jgi:hypothetical protein
MSNVPNVSAADVQENQGERNLTLNENSGPPLNRARCPSEPFAGKDRPPRQGATTGEGYGTDTTDAKGGTERVEKATSSSPVDTTKYQADKEIWTPLTGGTDKCGVALDADPTHEVSASAPRISCHPAIRNQAPPAGGSEKDGGWVPWTKDPYKNDRNEPGSDDSEERRRNCSLCYIRVRCYCTQRSDSGD